MPARTMTVSARDRAHDEQRRASDPVASTFVAASAGSGKTKLLIDRLLRLMLGGADPARIQCLTFTKAAAAEMDLRLRAVLSRWVTSGDAELAQELHNLDLSPDAALCEWARGLFARVLDLPGGMRIGTIHAFCQALLRRFPLEAGISPHFQVIEQADAEAGLTAAREEMLVEAHSPAAQTALASVAPFASARQFAALVERLRWDRERLERAASAGPEAQRRALGVTAVSETALLEEAVCWPEEACLRATLGEIAGHDACSPGVRARAERMLGWLARDREARVLTWGTWFACFHNANGQPAAESQLVNPRLDRLRPELRDMLILERDRVGRVTDACRAVRLADISAGLFWLATPVAAAYARRKDAAGQLDYDDLIAKTSAVLRDPGSDWVLYKLDGGLDHLLLDEVQDTAPAQWRIAGALTAEFFAGAGASEQNRTVFAVGDRKQSIYSFQGADPDEFERWRDIMRRRVDQVGRTWRDVALDVSFRSTMPVLALVDAVFADPVAAAGVVAPGTTLRHFADRAGQAGQVELWPLAPPAKGQEPPPWTVPDRYPRAEVSAPQRLAEVLATWIADQTSGAVMLPSRDRTLEPRDVLILVRRRNEFARALVRALKARGVPVAGLDRLVLTEQPAVADLLTLCDVLLLPEDDLSLACVLTSPLGGLNDDDLMALAPARDGTLWDALRARAGERLEWHAAWRFLSTLLARVDYTTPHALLTEALGPLGGRARLLARLGPEAAEPVDELLNAALDYARTNPPSLQRFLHSVRQSGTEVKREPEGSGHAVRVMTVHGAKGLQAPLVILPDTTGLPPDRDEIVWCEDPGSGAEVPLWIPRKALGCDLAAHLQQQARARRMEEHNRLLYVALTRAEDRLVICGWEPWRSLPETCWYAVVKRGFEALRRAGRDGLDAAHIGAVTGLPWEGEVWRISSQQAVPPAPATTPIAVTAPPLPFWTGRAPGWRAAPPPAEPALPQPLSPSRPEGAELGSLPHARSPLDGGKAAQALERGRWLHILLQHLPDLPRERRRDVAVRFLDRPGTGFGAEEATGLADETMAILDHPELAPLFGPGSRAEVPLTGVVAGSVIGGLVDRLAVLPDVVLVADYKTNRDPPPRVEETPVLYLRQMAAYRAVLSAIFADRPIRCALVWTEAARVEQLPPALLDRYAPGRLADPVGPAA
jgi:ATP-dependent helicase/nuclease subunit A